MKYSFSLIALTPTAAMWLAKRIPPTPNTCKFLKEEKAGDPEFKIFPHPDAAKPYTSEAQIALNQIRWPTGSPAN